MKRNVYQNPRILVIEADETDRKVLEHILYHRECKVHSIGFNRDIVKLLSNDTDFDCVVLSIEDPSVVTGVKIISVLRKFLPQVPIIVLCNVVNMELVQRVKSYGIKNVLNRHFVTAPLIRELNRTLRERIRDTDPGCD